MIPPPYFSISVYMEEMVGFNLRSLSAFSPPVLRHPPSTLTAVGIKAHLPVDCK